ncbi:MAG: hypothetical protein KKD38_01920 [Candidatus Delongbacteria bacterium]|nr:hypothetical protein [Candidatus Delongbacteria bacterium]
MTAITPNKDELIRKISALIHFSIKSGVAVIGQNRLELTNFKNIGLILMSSQTSENTEKRIINKAGSETAVKLHEEISLEGLIGKQGVKVIGFTNSELQRQIAKLIKTYNGI